MTADPINALIGVVIALACGFLALAVPLPTPKPEEAVICRITDGVEHCAPEPVGQVKPTVVARPQTPAQAQTATLKQLTDEVAKANRDIDEIKEALKAAKRPDEGDNAKP